MPDQFPDLENMNDAQLRAVAGQQAAPQDDMENMSNEQLKKIAQGSSTGNTGFGKNIAAGLAEGLAGTVNFFSDPVGDTIQSLENAGMQGYNLAAPYLGASKIPQGDMDAVKDNYGYVPLGTEALNYASKVAGVSPSDVIPGSPAERVAREAARGVLFGPEGVAGAVGAGEAANAFPQESDLASLLGGVAGGAGANMASRFAPSPTIPIEDAKLADLAINKYNIPVSVSQVSTSPVAKYAYSTTSHIPFSGAEDFNHAQREAWTRALGNTFGSSVSRITPDVLDEANTRIGGVFKDVAKRTNIPITDAFLDKLQNLSDVTKTSIGTGNESTIVDGLINNLLNNAIKNNDDAGGHVYQYMTKSNGPLAMATYNKSAPHVPFVNMIKDILDDHLEQNAAPEDIAALRTARQQWKHLKTVEPLTLRADVTGGASPSTGDISPAALRNAVKGQFYQNAARGRGGPLDDLARIGQRFLKEPPQSGTAPRQLMGEAIGALGGFAADALYDPEHFGAGKVASLAAIPIINRSVNASLRNQYLAKKAIQNSLNPSQPDALGLSVLKGLAGGLSGPQLNQTDGERIDRASGGKVEDDIEPLVQRLMDLADKAKKVTNNTTKPLLNLPDETVVKALAVAQKAI